MKKIIFIAATAMFSTGLWANGAWKCANSIAEVACQQGNCTAAHTPADSFLISIKHDTQVSVCAKNKCWRGNTQPNTRGNLVLYPIKQFNWTTLEQPDNEYTLAVNQHNKNLSIQGGNRNYPLQCVQA
ncbi:hypothetical protein [Acinetobacter tianfuensis]|uniref:Secreted protein n=1 Tax=Acinetobacter tianfuensis TaxID=2419603 RepID=A0A3A8EPH6_9GAMM|nr:hypothetical protein [Acinetobacter tianfuensis]RKG32650.1 hypothetical protein D7V32_05520 [Acinetobacter tianfuensis]